MARPRASSTATESRRVPARRTTLRAASVREPSRRSRRLTVDAVVMAMLRVAIPEAGGLVIKGYRQAAGSLHGNRSWPRKYIVRAATVRERLGRARSLTVAARKY